MTQILKAKPLIKKIYQDLRNQIEQLGISPRLVIIRLGEDPASSYYARNLQKKGSQLGMKIDLEEMSATTSQDDLISRINKISVDRSIHALMVQKPLPRHIDESQINEAIDYLKDVDGFNPINLGKIMLGETGFLPSTPAAVLALLDFYEIEVTGKHVVIIGRSNIVGKPLANLLLRKNKQGNATVTICHSRTNELDKYTSQADILIAAIGKAKFVKSTMVKIDSVLIDVGINRINHPERGYVYVGDIDFDDCLDKVKAITPVPGGIGSITTAKLLENVMKAYKNIAE